MSKDDPLRLAKWLDALPSSGYALTNQAAEELRRLHEEVTEQARLLGMGAERELALLALVHRLERVMKQAQQAIEACLSAGTEAEDRDASELLCDAWGAIKEALAQSRSDVEQPEYRAVKTWHEGKPIYVTEPAQEPVAWTDLCEISGKAIK